MSAKTEEILEIVEGTHFEGVVNAHNNAVNHKLQKLLNQITKAADRLGGEYPGHLQAILAEM